MWKFRTPKTAPEIRAVVDSLRAGRCPDRAAIQTLLQHRHAAIPTLKALVEDACRWRHVPDARAEASRHAIFLLAALEASEGLDPLVRLLRKSDDFIEDFFGDLLTECLPWALARLARHRPEALRHLMDDHSLDHFIRGAALRGFVAQAMLWPDERPRVIRELDEMLGAAAEEPDPDWNALLVSDVADLAPPELREKVNALFERQAVELTFITRDDVDRAYAHPDPTKQMTETLDVFSLYAQYRGLLGWNDPEIAAQRDAQEADSALDGGDDVLQAEASVSPPVRAVKIGRNQPCPCGSGVKYKKCCLGSGNVVATSRAD